MRELSKFSIILFAWKLMTAKHTQTFIYVYNTLLLPLSFTFYRPIFFLLINSRLFSAIVQYYKYVKFMTQNTEILGFHSLTHTLSRSIFHLFFLALYLYHSRSDYRVKWILFFLLFLIYLHLCISVWHHHSHCIYSRIIILASIAYAWTSNFQV